MRDRPLTLGVLVSGGGRSALNLQDHIARGALAARIAVVISSRSRAAAVERCAAAGLHVEIAERTALAPEVFQARIAELLRAAKVDLVVMAGFLAHWEIPDDFAGRVINIHPALLPRFGGRGFYGDRVHQAVLAAGEGESGCTVHFADDQYDHGPVILQRRVRVLPDDTPQTLAARVFAEEQRALPEAVRMFIEGRLPLPG